MKNTSGTTASNDTSLSYTEDLPSKANGIAWCSAFKLEAVFIVAGILLIIVKPGLKFQPGLKFRKTSCNRIQISALAEKLVWACSVIMFFAFFHAISNLALG